MLGLVNPEQVRKVIALGTSRALAIATIVVLNEEVLGQYLKPHHGKNDNDPARSEKRHRVESTSAILYRAQSQRGNQFLLPLKSLTGVIRG